jgi:hypothetical protein
MTKQIRKVSARKPAIPNYSVTRLTGAQRTILSHAAQRDDGAASPPDTMSEKAAHKLAGAMIERGFLREVRARADMPIWRRDPAADVVWKGARLHHRRGPNFILAGQTATDDRCLDIAHVAALQQICRQTIAVTIAGAVVEDPAGKSNAVAVEFPNVAIRVMARPNVARPFVGALEPRVTVTVQALVAAVAHHRWKKKQGWPQPALRMSFSIRGFNSSGLAPYR